MVNSHTGVVAPERDSTHRVSVVQFEPVHGDVDRNFETARALILRNEGPSPAIIVLPEMGLSGYIWSSQDEIMPHAVHCSDPATQAQWVDFARECQSWLVIGHPAHDVVTGNLTNRCTLVSPSDVVGHYDKTCLFSEDLTWATPGALVPPLWDTPIGTVSPLICADLDYPEPIHSAVSRGAQAIVFPTAWVGEPAPSATWMLRAHEHRVPIIAADLLGEDQGRVFSGGSCIISADGDVLVASDYDEGLVSADIIVGPSLATSAAPVTVTVHRVGAMVAEKASSAVVVSVWSGDPAEVPPAPTGLGGHPHLVVLPTASDFSDSWPLEAQAYATLHDALVVQGRGSPHGEPAELFVFSPEGGYFSLPSEVSGPRVALLDYCGVTVGVMRNVDLGSHHTSRALSVLGASVILSQGDHSLPAPLGHPGTLAPFPDNLGDADPSFAHPARFRAGDANVWLGFCSETESVPSGIFSPDHVAWPRNETLGHHSSWVSQQCSLDELDPWGKAAWGKPLVSGRGVELCGNTFLTQVHHEQWRTL